MCPFRQSLHCQTANICADWCALFQQSVGHSVYLNTTTQASDIHGGNDLMPIARFATAYRRPSLLSPLAKSVPSLAVTQCTSHIPSYENDTGASTTTVDIRCRCPVATPGIWTLSRWQSLSLYLSLSSAFPTTNFFLTQTACDQKLLLLRCTATKMVQKAADNKNAKYKYTIFYPAGKGYCLVKSLGSQGTACLIRSSQDGQLCTRRKREPEWREGVTDQLEIDQIKMYREVPGVKRIEYQAHEHLDKKDPRHKQFCSVAHIWANCDGGNLHSLMSATTTNLTRRTGDLF